MPRPRRQTNIQLLNSAFQNAVKISDDDSYEIKETTDYLTGEGARKQASDQTVREVKSKKKIDRKKKIEDKPINTRILLTR